MLTFKQGANLGMVGETSEAILFPSAGTNPQPKAWRHVWYRCRRTDPVLSTDHRVSPKVFFGLDG
ncbi:MAG: hypothetical protein ACE5IY_19580 [bacterium]